MKTRMLMGMSLAAIVLAGCETPPPPTAALGDSVRSVIEQQTFDPAASSRNGTRAPEGTDPDRALAAIAAMREGVARPVEEWNTVITTGGVPSQAE